ncbi:hypothetical protein CBR_g734 [Chara braunii]|uniref:Uncharacterized protein n=1 Tax=Chara braunii TaxID=69332 RepID=A0A388KC10_CHABU|nr:hypothetical protein CBR_g734 [Chara braunii]|eukprot:GBG67604.1 hypothetical protein CBR_g734 [Chara braunii]
MKDKSEDMLAIVWELEEGPDPRLDVYIDWRRADGIMSVCKTLFNEGRDLYALQEDWLEGIIDREDAHEVTAVPSRLTTTSMDGCDNNNSNNDNSGENTNNNNSGENIIINNNNNNNNNNDNINTNDDEDDNDDYGSSRADSCVRAVAIISDTMGEMPQVDDGEIGVGTKKGFVISPPSTIGEDDDGDDGVHDQGSSGVGSDSQAAEIIITAMGGMLQVDVVGYAVDTEKWFTAFPPFNLHTEFLLVVWRRIGVG